HLSQSLPAFLRDDLEQQWGIPPEHRSPASGVLNFEQFPAIPIPFCLRFREGSAIMCMVPSRDLDPFVSLCGLGVSSSIPKTVSPPKASNTVSSSPVTKAPVVPPRALRRNREIEGLKADASAFYSDNEVLSGFPSADTAPQASVGRGEPKSKTTVKVVEDSKVSDPPSLATAVYKRVRLPPCSRKITSTASKGKARQVVITDDNSASNEVESKDEDEDEDIVPPPKHLKTTSSISVKRVSVPKWVTKAAAKSVPGRSPDSTFQLVLLADAQGHLQLPNQSSVEKIPLLAINPDFLKLGSILETQNACFTMHDLMQINRVIRNPSIPSQACVPALARGDLEANSALLPGYKCQACSSRSLKCLGSLDVELAMDALNALHTTSTSSTHNLANSLRQAANLNNQLKQIGSLFDTTRELFLRSILDLQNAGEDPVVVLEALKAAKPNRQSINLNEWTLLATLFRWPSSFNLSGLDFDNRTPGKWIDLLRSTYSGESMACVNEDGHLVESSPPPDLATEVFKGLNEVEKGLADEGTISKVGGSIPMELDLPTIESLAKPTLSPEKGGRESADSQIVA
ncbi:hypothetical protein EV359DRAFT_68625, partial [Lentinula novae-zelandiae]